MIIDSINELMEAFFKLSQLGFVFKKEEKGKYYFEGHNGVEIVSIKDYKNKSSIVMPDYTNSSINMISSIRKSFGYQSKYPSLPFVDKFMPYKHIAVLVLDGMGMNVLEANLPKNSFLRKNLIKPIISTYPSTTVAATTSILTGLTPSETGYVGWHQYFKAIDDDIVVFSGNSYYSNKSYDKNIASQMLPSTHFYQDMKIRSFVHGPSYFYDGSNTLVEILDKLKGDFSEDECTYSYCYWDEPDSSLHQYGIKSNEVKLMLTDYDKIIEAFASSMDDDCCLIVTADHGHHEIKSIYFDAFPNITKFFTKKPSIESRAVAFFVRDKKGFENEFNKLFKSYFLLLSKEEFMKQGFIGNGNKADEFIGDYMALAIDSYSFCYKDMDAKFLSSHAGLTKEEMEIPLILIKNK